MRTLIYIPLTYRASLPYRTAALLTLLLLFTSTTHAEPPFSGTIFIDPDILTVSDPTTFQGAVYTGQDLRSMFDRRVNDFTLVNAHLFEATFDDGFAVEIQVNPEFGDEAAATIEATKYAGIIGRLPTALREEVDTVSIHQGMQPFGGGNNNLLIHTGQAELYEADGILEETFVHEAVHVSLDWIHASAPGWLAAQTADGEFISTYARDNPTREDVAESFLPYLAIRHRADRISATLYGTIVDTIPNRIDYFDAQEFDLYPIVPNGTGDFNFDGVVDAADYVAWRKGVAPDGYLTWRATFGTMNGDGGAVSSPVPEGAVTPLTAFFTLLAPHSRKRMGG
jgi:hypothetical protein